MKPDPLREQNGQTLVYVALAMVALLAFVSLAIDVGHTYQLRRRMQNAADAGALAGARAYCFNDGSPHDAAVDFATRNGAQSVTASDVVGGVITVTTGIVTNTFVAGIIGIPSVNVPAVAAAQCGVSPQACGIWPVAYPYNNYLIGGLEVYGWANNDACSTMWIWDDDQADINCSTLYQCDMNGDGKEDVIGGGTRGWLDLPCPAPAPYDAIDPCGKAGGANCLKCRIDYGYPGPITIGTCLVSKTGVVESDRQETNNVLNKTYWLPLFDEVCDPGAGKPKGYVVKQFGCIQNKGAAEICLWPDPSKVPGCPPPGPTEVKSPGECGYKSGTGCPKPNDKLKPVYVRVVKVVKTGPNCPEHVSCATDCGRIQDPGGPTPAPGDVVGVSLIH